MSQRSLLRALCVAAAVTVFGAGVAGCTSDRSAAPQVTEIKTVTGSPTQSSAPASASGSASSSKPTAKPTATAGDPAALRASFSGFADSLSQPVGVSIMAVGGGKVVSLGDQAPRVAWSTIKAPLALAAQRKNGITSAETAAIVNSDNGAAETLWASLGTPQQAAKAVTDVLREGGDKNTTVPSQRQRADFTIFGQTQWALNDAVTFTAHLPCLPGAEHVTSLMGQVAGNQNWGIEVIPSVSTAVKGGWGPGVSGGYVVRQIGLLTRKDGSQVAFALATYTPYSSMESGIAALNQVGDWIGERLDSLPAGNC